MKSTRVISTAVVLIVLAIAAYWWWSPHIVVHQMREAALRHDAEAIDAHVDYPALRESFRAQLSSSMTRKMGDPRDNPFSALGNMIGMAVAGPLVDALVQPATLAAALRSGELDPARPAASGASDTKGADVTWSYDRDGADVVIARAHRSGESSDAHPVAFVFVRHGFADWKLSEIRLAG
jgi:hypothetical protein